MVKEVATSKAFAVHEQFYPAVIYLSTDKICLAVMYNFVPSPQLNVTRKFDLKKHSLLHLDILHKIANLCKVQNSLNSSIPYHVSLGRGSLLLRFALFLLFGKILLRIFIGTLRDVEVAVPYVAPLYVEYNIIYIYKTEFTYLEYRIDNYGLKKHLPESVKNYT